MHHEFINERVDKFNFQVNGGQVIGGVLETPLLKRDLNEKQYFIVKSIVWLRMLEKLMIPVKWYKPTNWGTRIKFEMLFTDFQAVEALKHYEAFEKANRLIFDSVNKDDVRDLADKLDAEAEAEEENDSQ